MAFFKSKAERETERVSAEIAAEAKARRQTEYKQLLRAMDKIQALNPDWKLTGVSKKHYYYFGNLTFEAPDGVEVTLHIGEASSDDPWHRIFYRLSIYQIKSSSQIFKIYDDTFYSTHSPEAWEYLGNFVHPFFAPIMARHLQWENKNRTEQEEASKKFWS